MQTPFFSKQARGPLRTCSTTHRMWCSSTLLLVHQSRLGPLWLMGTSGLRPTAWLAAPNVSPDCCASLQEDCSFSLADRRAHVFLLKLCLIWLPLLCAAFETLQIGNHSCEQDGLKWSSRSSFPKRFSPGPGRGCRETLSCNQMQRERAATRRFRSKEHFPWTGLIILHQSCALSSLQLKIN